MFQFILQPWNGVMVLRARIDYTDYILQYRLTFALSIEAPSGMEKLIVYEALYVTMADVKNHLFETR